MADGKTHTRYYERGWKIVYPTSVLAGWFFVIKYDVLFGVLFIAFSLINYKIAKYITPDSDLMGLTIGEWDLLADTKKKFGWFGGLVASLWNAWWMIYAYISGKHRSWYSHGWGIGTVGRMYHFNLPGSILLFSQFQWNVHAIYSSEILMTFILSYLSSQFVYWFFADAIHLILDMEFAKGFLYTPVSRNKTTTKF